MPIFLLLFIFLAFPALADEIAGGVSEPVATQSVRYPATTVADDHRSDYFIALLRLALQKTEAEFGSAKLVAVPGLETQARAIAQLSKKQDIDVLWTMTSTEREKQLLPVRIPLLKGLMGLRFLVVREQDLKRFAHIRHLAQLRELTAGQGEDWPDTEVLRFNGLVVKTNVTYRSLFSQLEQARFDYLPRGFNEPFDELETRQDMRLVIEPRLALLYPAASYFFVSRDNQALATRIQQGLEIAIEDGSFDELFFNHPHNKEAFDKLNLEGRIIFKLASPVLPDKTPLGNAKLWYFKR